MELGNYEIIFKNGLEPPTPILLMIMLIIRALMIMFLDVPTKT